MGFIDDVKTDKRTQIMLGWSIFFMLAFPSYFAYASLSTDTVDYVGGPPGNYMLNGTFEYIDFDSGSETISDGTTVMINLHTDALGEVEGNVVGALVTLTHSDDETANGPSCNVVPGAGQTADDDVNSELTRGGHFASGATDGSTGSFAVYVVEDLLPGTVYENITKGDLEEKVTGGEAAFGEYALNISVTVNTGGGFTGCNHQDDGETVDWVIQLITFEPEISLVEEEEEEPPEE